MPRAKTGVTGWTPEDLAKAAEMWRTNHSAGMIAKAFNVSRNAFIGITYRNRDLFPPKSSIAQEGQRQWIAGARVQWSEAEIERASALWKRGQSVEMIAVAINRSVPALHRVANGNRDKFPKRRDWSRPEGRPRRPPAARAKAAPMQAPKRIEAALPAPAARPDCKPVSLMARTATQCAFPLWDAEKPDADSPYCGADVALDETYCRFHHRIMYQPRQRAA